MMFSLLILGSTFLVSPTMAASPAKQTPTKQLTQQETEIQQRGTDKAASNPELLKECDGEMIPIEDDCIGPTVFTNIGLEVLKFRKWIGG